MANEFSLHLRETCHGSTEPTEYVLTEHRLVARQRRRNFDGVIATLKDVFLPQGYPESVSSDYLTYQLWDTSQAFCSSITGALAGRAVLTGYGVGDQAATVAAATLAWLLRDGCGMIGRILFAWARGTALDWDCKRYRLLADGLNDMGILLQLLCPLAGAPGSTAVTAVLCLASVLLSLVGVCGGATRAALTMHQARRHNMADVSAKDASQETLVNLAALLFNLAFVPMITGTAALALAYAFFTAGHLFSNWRAVRSVAMETLNPSRLHLVVASFLASGGTACSGVSAVNRAEPLVCWHGARAHISLGCRLADAAAELPAGLLRLCLQLQPSARFTVFPAAGRFFVTLAEGSDGLDQIRASLQCELMHLAASRPELMTHARLPDYRMEPAVAAAAAAAAAERMLPALLEALRRAGWVTSPAMLGAGQHRLAWAKSA